MVAVLWVFVSVSTTRIWSEYVSPSWKPVQVQLTMKLSEVVYWVDPEALWVPQEIVKVTAYVWFWVSAQLTEATKVLPFA